jgi:uncharacterized protein YbjT (DUF2867 family)
VLIDYTKQMTASEWIPHLANVDTVVNAVGVLLEDDAQTFDALHIRGPKALFQACATAGVKVVQISALGASITSANGYYRSKAVADDFLLNICDGAVVAQPSLVYGKDGASGRLFTSLATLPVIPIPAPNTARIQPIYIDDITAALVKLVETDTYRNRKVALVGPDEVTLKDFLAVLRHSIGLGKAAFITVPSPVMKAIARVAGILPGSLLNAETLEMLAAGNSADSAMTHEILGRSPRPPSAFIAQEDAQLVRRSAALNWLLPILRGAIAAVWIGSGIVSVAFYPSEESFELLERAGVVGVAAVIALYGAAALDIAFGIASVGLSRRRWLWVCQAAVIVIYSAIIAFALPEYWLHPFGPILKNVVLLAALLILYELEVPERPQQNE